ncbi:MAG: VCBS repeat-containing protein [candidate division KSB1 bacterium]|nr:VCBS repeat-containing protein [candidate division KSB1 bacterium]
MKTVHLSSFLAAMMATAAFAPSWSWQPEDRLINPSGVQIHRYMRVAAGDIDADGWPDVMIVDSEGVRFYRNLAMPSGLQFEQRPDWALDVGVAGYPPFYKPALADLDGDRRAEVILPVPGQSDPVFRCYRFDPGLGEWRSADTLVTGLPGGTFITLVDFDRDGDPDAVIAG